MFASEQGKYVYVYQGKKKKANSASFPVFSQFTQRKSNLNVSSWESMAIILPGNLIHLYSYVASLQYP